MLKSDGSYEKIDRRGKISLDSQEYFTQEAREKARQEKQELPSRVFIPEEHIEE